MSEDKAFEARANSVMDRLGAAVEAKDIAAIGEIYSDRAVIWHNYDELVQDRQRNLTVLSGLFSIFDNIGYRNVRREVIGRKIIQQHDLAGRAIDGTEFSSAICLICFLDDDGRIDRVEEYLDIGRLAALRKKLAQGIPAR